MSTARIQVSACAVSATVNHLRLRPNGIVSGSCFNNHFNSKKPLRIKKPLSLRVSMSSVPPSEPFEIAVKASVTTPNRLGDCNITHPFFPTLFICLFSVLSFSLVYLMEIEMKLAFEGFMVWIEVEKCGYNVYVIAMFWSKDGEQKSRCI